MYKKGNLFANNSENRPLDAIVKGKRKYASFIIRGTSWTQSMPYSKLFLRLCVRTTKICLRNIFGVATRELWTLGRHFFSSSSMWWIWSHLDWTMFFPHIFFSVSVARATVSSVKMRPVSRSFEYSITLFPLTQQLNWWRRSSKTRLVKIKLRMPIGSLISEFGSWEVIKNAFIRTRNSVR